MKKILSAFLLVGLVSCGVQETTKVEVEDTSVATEEKKEVVANAEVEMNIEGMTCMINCVTVVKKALKNTEGVGEVTVDFDPDRSIDKALIKFDDQLVSEDQIKSVIEELNNGIYKVVDAPTDSTGVTQETETTEEDNTSVIKDVKENLESMAFKEFEIPSLFQVLNKILF